MEHYTDNSIPVNTTKVVNKIGKYKDKWWKQDRRMILKSQNSQNVNWGWRYTPKRLENPAKILFSPFAFVLSYLIDRNKDSEICKVFPCCKTTQVDN